LTSPPPPPSSQHNPPPPPPSPLKSPKPPSTQRPNPPNDAEQSMMMQYRKHTTVFGSFLVRRRHAQHDDQRRW
jgi:hypothetical protein